MNRKEVTKTVMMISNRIKPFGLHGLYTNIQRSNPLTAGAAYIRVLIFY